MKFVVLSTGLNCFWIKESSLLYYFYFFTVDFQGLLELVEDQGPRGLEGYSSRLHALRRARHVQDSKHAVFLEQARQNIANQRDDEQLARQAKMASSRARTFATMLGQADAWAARDNDSSMDAARQTTDLPTQATSKASASEGTSANDVTASVIQQDIV